MFKAFIGFLIIKNFGTKNICHVQEISSLTFIYTILINYNLLDTNQGKKNDVYSKNIIFIIFCLFVFLNSCRSVPVERAKLTVSLTEILSLIAAIIIHQMPTIKLFFCNFFFTYLKFYSNTWILLLVIFPTKTKKCRKTNIFFLNIIFLSDRTVFLFTDFFMVN